MGWNFVLGKVLWGSSAYYLNLFALVAGFFNFSFALFRPTWRVMHLLKPRLGVMWVLGLLGVILFPATLYEGLKTTTALNASLYLAISPVLVLFLNRLVFKEKISPIILSGQ